MRHGGIGAAFLIGSLAASAMASGALSARLEGRVARLLASSGARPVRFGVGRYKPLLTEPHANCHAVALRAGRDGLTVVHRWEYPGEYDVAVVPWEDIVADKVRYSLSSMYGGPRQKQIPEGSPSCPPGVVSVAPQKSTDSSTPRCLPLSSGETLVGQGRAISLVDLQKTVVWKVELPAGHTLIDFAVYERLLFVATVSNQGAVDGELLRPYLTTQVFAIEQPSINR